jgi:hypothetical protein
MPPAHAHGTECAHVPRIEGPIVNRQIMPNQAQLRQVIGATAYDRDGDKLGNIRPIYYDNDTPAQMDHRAYRTVPQRGMGFTSA